MNGTSTAVPAWQEAIFTVLKEGGVRQVAYVPDAGHAHVIRRVIDDPGIEDVLLTTEEEGVALACGAWLGGERAVLLMQSSGVGNCVNMFSLLQSADFPFFALVTMRGEYAEFNPWQGPMGKATQRALELMGIHVLRASDPDKVGEIVSAGFDAAFGAGEKIAVLLGQDLIGRKKWEGQMTLDRRRFVAALIAAVPDALVVTGLGSPAYDVFAAGDRDRNYYLWGAMGGAGALGLGLALARPGESVVVITGDGEQLMGIGTLATIGAKQPKNLTIVVLDNGHFGETGMQRSHSSLGTDFVAVAKGFGIADALAVDSLDACTEIARRILARAGPTFVRARIDASEPPRVLPPRDGPFVKNRFRAALGLKPF